ncbi:MAG: TadE/TadG family type IV pilus assembly protein [Planctomycetota bacterium]
MSLIKLKGFLREIRDDDSGQAMVETAIIFPLYIAVICVIMETAVLANAYFMTDYAAYCAARAGIVHMGNLEPMMIAASVALGPITGTASGLNPRSMNSGTPLLNSAATLLTSSAMAFLHFNEVASVAEYTLSSLADPGVSLEGDLEHGIYVKSPRGIHAAIVRKREDSIGADSTIEDKYLSINQIMVLKLNNASDGSGSLTDPPQFERREDLPGKETVSILDEEGNSSTGGYRYNIDTAVGTVKKNRMRVEISHFHTFMFPSLPWILSLIARGGPGVSNDDVNSLLAGRIVVRGFCTMRMQSNFLEQNITAEAHDNIHTGFPPNPFD